MNNSFYEIDIVRQLLYSTVRIDTTDKNHESWSATGFLVSYEKEGKTYSILVTNRHVVADAISGRLTFLKKDTDNCPIIPSKHEIELDNFAKEFTCHPNKDVDVAILPIEKIVDICEKQQTPIFFLTVPQELFLNNEQLGELNAIEDVTFIGYPKGLRDEMSLSPIVRRGITATPIDRNFENKPIFLIDASVHEGSSGSPVFILHIGFWGSLGGKLTVSDRIILLGIISKSRGFYQENKTEKQVLSEDPMTSNSQYSKQYLNIGTVFKTETIVETLDFWAKSKF